MASNSSVNNMLANQEDPMLFLLQNSTLTQNLELQIQGGVSQVLQSWSEGASDQISAGDADLASIAASMADQNPDAAGQREVMILQAVYNTRQTQFSNLNNQYSNVMQGGGTVVNNLTQVEQQALQLCQVTVDFQNNVNQLISGWGS